MLCLNCRNKKHKLPLPLSLSLSGLNSAHITLPSTPLRLSRPPTCTQTRSKWDQLCTHPYSWGRCDIITWVHSESPTPMHLRRYHKVKRGRVWRHMRIHAGVCMHLCLCALEDQPPCQEKSLNSQEWLGDFIIAAWVLANLRQSCYYKIPLCLKHPTSSEKTGMSVVVCSHGNPCKHLKFRAHPSCNNLDGAVRWTKCSFFFSSACWVETHPEGIFKWDDILLSIWPFRFRGMNLFSLRVSEKLVATLWSGWD